MTGHGSVYCMFATGNSTLLPGMAAQPQPGRYEGRGVSPSAATTLTHASLLSSAIDGCQPSSSHNVCCYFPKYLTDSLTEQ